MLMGVHYQNILDHQDHSTRTTRVAVNVVAINMELIIVEVKPRRPDCIAYHIVQEHCCFIFSFST
ncbi:MAG: hypothetical protein AABW48_03000 [Nanoarchaeota archaeon]